MFFKNLFQLYHQVILGLKSTIIYSKSICQFRLFWMEVGNHEYSELLKIHAYLCIFYTYIYIFQYFAVVLLLVVIIFAN